MGTPALGFVTHTDEVQSIAALRLLGAPASGTAVVWVSGYYAPLDGGGGDFWWDPSSTATDDGGTTIRPSGISIGNPGRWLRDFPRGYYNVLQFGAKRTTAGENFDSLFAFDAAMLAMGPPYAFTDASYAGKVLLIPPSNDNAGDTFYRLSGTFNVNRNCKIVGSTIPGGSVGGATKMKFDYGSPGVTFYSVYDGTGQRADGSVIKGCEIYSTFPGDVATVARWRPNQAYSLGDIIVPKFSANRYGYAYKCTTAGTTGSTEPAFPGQALGGAESPDAFDDATYSDGSVVWTTVQIHGIDVRSNFVQIIDCYVHHWPGNGISCHGATGESTYNEAACDITQIRGGTVRYCGASGIHFAGHDANAGYVTGVSSTQNLGWGFRDDSVLGQLFQSCHSDNNLRGSYFVGRAMDCYSEGGVLSFFDGMHWIGGIPGRFSNDYQKTWQAGEAVVSAADTRVPTTPNGYQYVCYVSGTTGGTEPDWPVDGNGVVIDGTAQWYCFGEYAVNHAQASIDLYGIHTPMTFRDRSSAVGGEFYAGLPQNAGALWGWRLANELFTMQPGPAAHVLTWGNATYGEPTQPHHPFAVTTSDLVFADDVGAGRLDILWPFFIGNPYGALRIKVYVDSVPPSDGSSDWKNEYWGLGSRVLNKNAGPGGIDHWVCSVAGTPGTWVAKGNGGGQKDVTAGGAVAIDTQLGDLSVLTSNANVTGITLAVGFPGQTFTLEMVQGDAAHTWATTITNARLAGGSFTKSPGAGAVDSISFRYNGTAAKWDEISRSFALA